MDMYQKREMRKNKKMNEDAKSLPSTRINWYPGHMAKTKRQILEKIDLIDVVYELVDARIPYSSKMKDVDEIVKNKQKILIMTKYDLCDKEETSKWQEYYEKLGYKVLLLDLNNNNDLKKLINETNLMMAKKQEIRDNKGLLNKQIKVLVMGIPNVGKSTLINKLAGKKVSNTGNMPGVTKSLSWLKTKSNILLLDTPGILWPKMESEEVALNLAATSAIKQEILPLDKVACHILDKLDKYYPNILKERYHLDDFSDVLEGYEKIGRKIGAVISGGEINYERVSIAVINDVKNEYVKGITFDRCEK